MDKLARTLKIGCIQLKVGANKAENIARAVSKIRDAKNLGAELIALPGLVKLLIFKQCHADLRLAECFNSPYGVSFFPQYAESIPDGETSIKLSGTWFLVTLEIIFVVVCIPRF